MQFIEGTVQMLLLSHRQLDASEELIGLIIAEPLNAKAE